MPARARVFVPVAVVSVVVIAVALALFQPWRLWVDEKVVTATPEGATALTIAPAASSDDMSDDEMKSEEMAADEMKSEEMAADEMKSEEMADEEMAETAAPMPTTFISIDHTTSGNVVLLQDADGKRFLRFEGLATDSGPDLKVYLSTNTFDGPEGAFDDDFVNLGMLQGNLGDQNYEIPADVDLSRFRSVVIWCDRFNSAFGAAPLA